MKKLQFIFDSEPEQMEDNCLATWKKLGPFNLFKLVAEKKIFIDDRLKLAQAISKAKRNEKYDYFG